MGVSYEILWLKFIVQLKFAKLFRALLNHNYICIFSVYEQVYVRNLIEIHIDFCYRWNSLCHVTIHKNCLTSVLV